MLLTWREEKEVQRRKEESWAKVKAWLEVGGV
jgi:hypothetical protein